MNEVVPGLFVGDMDDCRALAALPESERAQWNHLCVLQAPCGRGDHIQFVHGRPDNTLHASARCLRRIARWLDAHRLEGTRTLVHCGHGIERSPLAVTWYLGVWRGMGLEPAWRLVSEKRSQAQDRRVWLR